MSYVIKDEFGIETSIRLIQERLAPGRVVHCSRRAGKSTALLEWVHGTLPEEGVRKIGFVTHDWESARRLEAESKLR